MAIPTPPPRPFPGVPEVDVAPPMVPVPIVASLKVKVVGRFLPVWKAIVWLTDVEHPRLYKTHVANMKGETEFVVPPQELTVNATGPLGGRKGSVSVSVPSIGTSVTVPIKMFG